MSMIMIFGMARNLYRRVSLSGVTVGLTFTTSKFMIYLHWSAWSPHESRTHPPRPSYVELFASFFSRRIFQASAFLEEKN